MSDKKALAAALIKAQQSMDGLYVDGTNPHFRSKYATLAAVNATCLRPLAENGVAVFQSARTEDGERGLRVVVRTELYHAESGESFVEELALRPVKETPQDIGSAITYGRRYLLMTMAGLAPEDDDGNAASGRAPQATQRRSNGTPPQRQPGEEAERLRKRFHALGTELYGDGWDAKRHALVNAVTKGATTSSADLTVDQMTVLIEGMEKHRNAFKTPQTVAA